MHFVFREIMLALRRGEKMQEVKSVKELYAKLNEENRKKLLEYAEKLNLDSSKEDFRSQEAFEDSRRKDCR